MQTKERTDSADYSQRLPSAGLGTVISLKFYKLRFSVAAHDQCPEYALRR